MHAPAEPPDPAQLETPAQWARGLQRLRERSGLSVRDLARAVGASPSTVGGYVSGRHLPTIAATDLVDRVLRAVGVTDDAERAGWLDALARVRRSPAPRAPDAPPYKGLDGYGLDDAAWFVGREDLTDRLVAIVTGRDGGPPAGPVLVVGASGSGKSSLLRAGLGATLAAAGWLVLVRTPGDDPTTVLRDVAEQAAAATADGRRALVVVDQLEELWTTGGPEHSWRTAVRALLDVAATTPDVVVVAGLRADFYPHALASGPLAAALQERQVVVGPLSRDGLARAVLEPAARAGADVEPGLVDLLLRDLAPAGPRADGEAYDPGALPLLSFALLQTWQRGPRRLTVADYVATGGIAGAVADAAERVFAGLDEREAELARRLFTGLVAVGDGVADTRRRAPHGEVDALDAEDEEADGTGVSDVVEAFVAARLLTATRTHVEISHEALLGAWPRLRGWLDDDRAGLLLRRGLTAAATAWDADGREPDGLLRGGRLAALEEWSQRSPHARGLTAVERAFLTASSRRAAAARTAARRRTRRLTVLAWSLAALLVAVLGLAGYVQTLRADAEGDRDLALSRQLAEAATRLRDVDPSVAAQFALLAYRTSPTVEGRSALLDAAAMPLGRRLDGPGGIASVALSGDGSLMAAIGAGGGLRLWSTTPGSPDVAPRRAATVPDAYVDPERRDLYAVAVSPAGSRVATGGLGGAVRLWDTTVPDRPREVGRLDTRGLTVLGLAFSRNGILAAALTGPDPDATGDEPSTVGRVALWTTDDVPRPVGRAFLALPSAVQAVAFDSTGETLAVGTGTGAVHRFRLAAGDRASSTSGVAPAEVTPALFGPTAVVTSLAFSPDGRTLAAGSKDLDVHLWSVDGPSGDAVAPDPARPEALQRTLTGAKSYVNVVAFSADGSTLVAGGADSRTRVYDVASDYGLVAEIGNPGPVTAAAFERGAFVTAGADGAVRIWPYPLPLSGIRGGRTFGLAYLRPDRLLAMTSLNSARLIDVGSSFSAQPLSPNFGAPTDEQFAGTLAVGPGGFGAGFVAGGRSGTVWVYGGIPSDGAPSGTELKTGQTALVEAAALSPDGSRLVTSSDDASLVLSDISNGADLKPLGEKVSPGGIVYALAAAPSGGLFASGTGTSGQVDLWRIDDDRLTKVATAPTAGGPTLQVYGLSFSPDGGTLAVGAADRTVRLLDVSRPEAPRWTGRVVTDPADYVFGVQFDAVGRRLATASGDGVVRVYEARDLGTPEPRLVPYAALAAVGRAPVYSVALRPDGGQVSAGGGPQAVHTWSLDPERAAARVCSLDGDPVTREEWARYLPSVPYSRPCA